jgi:hypothetical protein
MNKLPPRQRLTNVNVARVFQALVKAKDEGRTITLSDFASELAPVCGLTHVDHRTIKLLNAKTGVNFQFLVESPSKKFKSNPLIRLQSEVQRLKNLVAHLYARLGEKIPE